MREHINIVNMKEQELIHTAIKNIPIDLGIKIIWENNYLNEIDGRIKLTFDGQEIYFNAEIKKELREHQLPVIELTAKNYPPLILIAHYLRPKIKEELRKRNIAYLEKNGNIFFKQKGKAVLVNVNKPVNLVEKTGNRAFTDTGLKVVFQFLINDKLTTNTYREIAEKTETALGNVNNIMKGLEKEGFLIKLDKERKLLQNKKNLLEKWMVAYKENLQPKLKIGRFRFANEKNFTEYRKLQFDENTTWWGGEPAGEILTNYLRPGELTLYTILNRNELIKKYRLVPDQNGNVLIYNAFWNTTKIRNKDIVHPLLVYVDLMNTGDSRCHETAKLIMEKHLANEF